MPKVKYDFNPKIMGLRYHPVDGADINDIAIKLKHWMYSKEQAIHQGILVSIIGDEVGIIAEKEHIHYHFETQLSDNTIRSHFHKFRESIGDTREKSNAIYALTIPSFNKKNAGTEEQQKDRFLRYPLKICGLKYKEICVFPEHWKNDNCPEFMARLAKDEAENIEREIANTEERNEKKEAKKAEIITLMDDIHAKTPFTSTRSILVELIKYYSEERESVDLRHATNKAIFFELRYGLTNLEKLANEAINKYR